MKLLPVLAVAILYSLTLKAQDGNVFKRKPWEEYKQKRLLQDTFNRVFSFPPARKSLPEAVVPGVFKIPLKGMFLKENGKGDNIYVMQIDKMPCLVPGNRTVFNMPVAGLEKNNLNLNPEPDKEDSKNFKDYQNK